MSVKGFEGDKWAASEFFLRRNIQKGHFLFFYSECCHLCVMSGAMAANLGPGGMLRGKANTMRWQNGRAGTWKLTDVTEILKYLH